MVKVSSELLNFSLFYSIKRDFSKRIDEMIKSRKAFIIRETFDKAKVNLLGDDGEFECAENIVKKNVGNFFA